MKNMSVEELLNHLGDIAEYGDAASEDIDLSYDPSDAADDEVSYWSD